jgi:hypothetical protein
VARTNLLDDVANDLALWIDQISTEIAVAFSASKAPFSASVTEEQKLEYYRSRLFNPDGSPNPQGREAEIQRLGISGFSQVYKAIINRWPELRVPSPPPIEVPQEWPAAGPPGPPGGPPGPPVALPPGPAGTGPLLPRPPGSVAPPPPMMPPPRR